jgi:hypothetical protein
VYYVEKRNSPAAVRQANPRSKIPTREKYNWLYNRKDNVKINGRTATTVKARGDGREVVVDIEGGASGRGGTALHEEG